VDLSELAEERWAAGLPAAPTVGRPAGTDHDGGGRHSLVMRMAHGRGGGAGTSSSCCTALTAVAWPRRCDFQHRIMPARRGIYDPRRAECGEPNGGSARAYEVLGRSHSVRTDSPTCRHSQGLVAADEFVLRGPAPPGGIMMLTETNGSGMVRIFRSVSQQVAAGLPVLMMVSKQGSGSSDGQGDLRGV